MSHSPPSPSLTRCRPLSQPGVGAVFYMSNVTDDRRASYEAFMAGQASVAQLSSVISAPIGRAPGANPPQASQPAYLPITYSFLTEELAGFAATLENVDVLAIRFVSFCGRSPLPWIHAILLPCAVALGTGC